MSRLGALALTLIACSDPASTPPDAAVDAPVAIDAVNTTTNLNAMFGSVQRTLDRAHFGVVTTASGSHLRIEAYRGGGTGCPTMTSPETDYTLILGNVPMPTGMTPVTSPGNILDFVGDLLNGALGAPATAVTITPTASDAMMFAANASLTFSGGTITGHLHATHCDSLDDQQ